jgi:hypothetical protein
LENGVQNPKEIRKLMHDAANEIGPMSVAGFKAAISKGQTVPVVDFMAGRCNS